MPEGYSSPKYISSSSELANQIQLGETMESMYLDFKLEINFHKKKQEVAEELALDICQFANTWGGVLLIGIQESQDPISRKKVAQQFVGVSDCDALAQFANDLVLPLMHPKGINMELTCIGAANGAQIVAINISPLAVGVACVCNQSPPYSSRYPYRTHYGKKYFHPMEVERRMVDNYRRIPIILNELQMQTRQVTLYPVVIKEPIDKPEKWDSQGTNILLVNITTYEFTLNIGGIIVNIPFSLVRDVWLTEKKTIGIFLEINLIMTSDRKSINLEL